LADKKDFIRDIHYYLEGDRVVFTALFHLQRDHCGGNYCRHCPYEPSHIKNNIKVKEEFAYLKEKP
jgi:hypothetical protein